MTRPWRAGVAVATGLAAGALFLLAHGEPGYSVGRLCLIVSVGVLIVGAGLVASANGEQRIGVLLILAGAAWLLERLLQEVPNGLAATVGGLLTGLWVGFLVHAIVTFPTGRGRSTVDRSLVGVGYLVTFGLNVPWFLFLPTFAPGGERNVLVVHADQGVADGIRDATDWLTAGWIAAVLVLLLVRLVRASPAARRAHGPVWVAGSVFLANLEVLVVAVLGAYAYRDAYGLWLEVIAGLVPITLAATLFTARLAEDRLVALVADLESGGTTTTLRDALRTALADPTLDVVYARTGSGGWADGLGNPPAAGTIVDRVTTPIEREGKPVAALVHDAALLQRPDRLRAAVAAANLAIDSLQLKAALRAQVAEIQASRARIVEAGERERRRVERDLHDGAQQRLVGLALTLRLASRTAVGQPALTELLDEAVRELDDAIRELRELARGIHPALVDDTGLAGAVEALAERPGIPLALHLQLPSRLPKAVEVGAYYLVAEALTNANKHSHASLATVRGEMLDGSLRVSVSDDGIGGAAASDRSGLEGLADRISALGGELVVTSPPGGGTTVMAEIPLAPVPGSATDGRRMRALQWIGFQQWEMPPEAFEQITDEDNLTAARGTLLLAGGNGEVTPREREWLVGYHTAAGTADWVIEAIASGADPGTLAELTSEPGFGMIARSLVYDALRMCSADGPLTPAELDRIERAAGSIGIAADVVSDLAEIVAADEALRGRRYDVVAAPLLPDAAHGAG